MSERPRHILFFSYHLPMYQEPGAFRPWMEARLLKRVGFQVTVITSGVHYMTGKNTRQHRGWCSDELYDGIRVLKTWAPTAYRLSILRRILNYLCYAGLAGLAGLTKVGKIDRIFAGTDPIPIMPLVFVVSRLKGAGLVLDERDLYPETAIALGIISEGCFSHLLFLMQQFFRGKALYILAATPGIREKLLEYGCSVEKVQLLYNADSFMETESGLDAEENSLRQQTGKQFLVGYSGGLGKANDILTLLRAAHHLRDFEDLGIIIIGGGEKLDQYRDYCRQHGLGHVLLTGPVSRQQARAWLRQIDICVHLYPDKEIFKGALASKVFDYFGLGKPVVFCGRGDTVKLLAESGGGVSLAPGDDQGLAEAINRLVQDEPLRRSLGTAARVWFETHINVQVASDVIKRAMNCEPN